MNRESTQHLKLDRRLIRRRNWIPADELERALAALPDVSHKIARSDAPEPSPDERSGAGSSDPTAGG